MYTFVDIFQKSREETRKKFPAGTKVMAVLYNLRHENIYDPQPCEVVKCTTEEECKEGYRFGVIVKFNDREYWVLPEDCSIIS